MRGTVGLSPSHRTGRFTFQNGKTSIWQLDKKIYIRKHKRMLTAAEHFPDFEDTVSCDFCEHLSHDIFQQGTDLFLVLVCLIIVKGGDAQLVIVDIPRSPKG